MDDNIDGSRSFYGLGKTIGNGSRYADRPYRVGKGKPPVEHQFRKGGPSPHPQGRPRGSTRTNSLEKLLRKRVTVTDRNGRRVRKAIGEVIDHKLVELAAGGDLKAIRLVKDIELQLRRLGFINEPTAEEVAKEAAELEERNALSAKLVMLLEEEAYRKKQRAPRCRPEQLGSEEPDDESEAG